jgi:EAL domain-containing protein (putative c-di-GMP-specific phosphodiesterase class I)
MQGYLYSRPLPAAEFQELLASKKSLTVRARRVTG